MLKTPQPKGTSGDDAYVFDNHKEEEAKVTELKQMFQKLKIVARAKVTQDRIYSAAYHPEPTKDLIFFGGTVSIMFRKPHRISFEADKHGQLGIWDAQAPVDVPDDNDDDDSTPAEDREGGKYHRLQMHWPASSKSSISCIKLDPIDSFSVSVHSLPSTVPYFSPVPVAVYHCIRLHNSDAVAGVWYRFGSVRNR